jgi:hypothetical protein
LPREIYGNAKWRVMENIGGVADLGIYTFPAAAILTGVAGLNCQRGKKLVNNHQDAFGRDILHPAPVGCTFDRIALVLGHPRHSPPRSSRQMVRRAPCEEDMKQNKLQIDWTKKIA